jgi:hypothetical protein
LKINEKQHHETFGFPPDDKIVPQSLGGFNPAGRSLSSMTFTQGDIQKTADRPYFRG